MPTPRSRQSASKARRSSHKDDSSDNDSTDDVVTWDTSTGIALGQFLDGLEENDSLFSEVRGLRQLFEKGTVRGKDNKTTVENDNHMADIKAAAPRNRTFRDPFPANVYERRSLTWDVSTPAAPPAPAPAPAASTPSPSGTSTSTSTLPPGMLSPGDSQRFAINGDLIEEVDREGAIAIAKRITNKHYAKRLLRRHHSSGREIVRYLEKLRLGKVASTEDEINDELTKLVDTGLTEASVSAYNLFTGEYEKYNNAHPRPKPEDELATIFKAAVRDLSLVVQTSLDLKYNLLCAKKGVDILTLDDLNDVATAVLTDVSRDASRAQRKAQREGHALRASDPDKSSGDNPNKKVSGKNKKKKTDKRPPRPPWDVSQGPCKHCGNGDAEGANKGHWNSDCRDNPKNKSDGHAKSCHDECSEIDEDAVQADNTHNALGTQPEDICC